MLAALRRHAARFLFPFTFAHAFSRQAVSLRPFSPAQELDFGAGLPMSGGALGGRGAVGGGGGAGASCRGGGSGSAGGGAAPPPVGS